MIKVMLGDLTKVEGVDYIVNAANGVGPMKRGIAGAIYRAGGSDVERDAYAQCRKLDPQPGWVYFTTAGKLPYKKIIHLVTMKQPGGPTSYEIVRKCLETLVETCKARDIKKVALPALSTGVGGLDKGQVASIFKKVLSPVEDIEFLIVDIDKEFISQFDK